MKCNKCLKQIPKGEEIRMFGNGGDWGQYGRKGSYGGCYCEACWKVKDEYKRYEEGGKAPSDGSKSSLPSWGWFMIGVIATLVVIGIIWLIIKDKD